MARPAELCHRNLRNKQRGPERPLGWGDCHMHLGQLCTDGVGDQVQLQKESSVMGRVSCRGVWVSTGGDGGHYLSTGATQV